MSSSILSLNGKIVPVGVAKVLVHDRGFQLGDGVYEVIRIYNGKTFALDRHLRRLERSLDSVKIKGVDIRVVEYYLDLMMAQESFEASFADALVYIQVTRGEMPRVHSFTQALAKRPSPEVPVTPTVMIEISKYDNSNVVSLCQSGCRAITQLDIRWKMCHIKSTSLQGNVLLAEEAEQAGAYEAILVDDDGYVTEGSRTNVFAVIRGKLRTAPITCNILHGITREILLQLVAEAVQVLNKPFSVGDLLRAEEVFLTGTTTEVMPVVSIDGKPVADGLPGKVTRSLQLWFENYRRVSL